MAVSACFRRVSESGASSGKRLTPIEALTKISTPETTKGAQQRAADLPRDDRGGLAGVLGVVLVAVRLDVGEEDEELVASLAGDYVGGARRALKASRDRAQELVAGRVAEAVVDQLEVVQVDEEDGGRALLSGTAVERLVEPLLEGDAVRAGRSAGRGRRCAGAGAAPPRGRRRPSAAR